MSAGDELWVLIPLPVPWSDLEGGAGGGALCALGRVRDTAPSRLRPGSLTSMLRAVSLGHTLFSRNFCFKYFYLQCPYNLLTDHLAF